MPREIRNNKITSFLSLPHGEGGAKGLAQQYLAPDEGIPNKANEQKYPSSVTGRLLRRRPATASPRGSL
jgi:hypothetical protein